LIQGILWATVRGMRGRPKSSARLWVEELGVLDIAKLPRPQGNLPAAHDASERVLSPQGLALSSVAVTITSTNGQKNFVSVKLAATRPYFGGLRYWYRCPECGHRAGKLYVTDEGKRLACRRCLRAVYECQYRKGWRWAWFRRIRKWMEASEVYRRRWLQRFVRAWASGKLTDLKARAILGCLEDLPPRC
jgi:hypothetical protein